MAKTSPRLNFFDLWQDLRDIRRNILLEEQLKSSLEQEELAKQEQQANEAFREQQITLEQQRVSYEKQRLELLAKEQQQQDLSRDYCNRIYDAGMKLKYYSGAKTPVEQFLLLQEVEDLLGSIDRNGVLDLNYRDRMVATEEELWAKEEEFAQKNEALMPSFQQYERLQLETARLKKIDSIRNFEQVRKMKQICADAAEVRSALEGIYIDTSWAECRIQCFYQWTGKFLAFRKSLIACKVPAHMFTPLSDYIMNSFSLEKSVLEDAEIQTVNVPKLRKEDWNDIYDVYHKRLIYYVREQLLDQKEAQRMVNFLAKKSGKRPVSIRMILEKENPESISIESVEKENRIYLFFGCLGCIVIAVVIGWVIWFCIAHFTAFINIIVLLFLLFLGVCFWKAFFR